MKVKIHNAATGRVYVAASVKDCDDETDVFVYELVCEFDDVITVGDMIGQPHTTCGGSETSHFNSYTCEG